MEITQLIQEIIFYSIVNSFVTFGIVKTIQKITEKEKLNRFIGLSITYGIGIITGFMIKSGLGIWERLAYGFFIGACSVAIYKSATQSLLDLIPSIVEKIIGKKSNPENEETG